MMMTSGPPDFENPEPPDGWPTIVRLPLLPSPDEMAQMRGQRARIEDELRQQAATAVQSVAEWAAAVGKAGKGLDDAVAAARAAGASWPAIADAVGISRQAAAERWGNR